MSTYNLSQTAAEIDSAIGKVHNADTAPTEGSTSMVTSGGVYTAVNNVGISALPITTEAQGIANYDNDSNVPTNAAVKDYVDSSVQDFAVFSASDNTSGIGSDSSIDINGTVIAGSFASISDGTLTLDSGTYELGLCGDFSEDDNDAADYWNVSLRVDGSDLGLFKVDETSSVYEPYSISAFYFKPSSIDVTVYADEISNPSVLRWQNVRVFVRKLT